MNDLAYRVIEANGFRFRVAEAGAGPLVVLCHGFPELAYSWRYQLAALAAAGYRAVAPDMRGYGGSDAPVEIDAYAVPQLAGDVVGIVAALGASRAHLVGHDWGATLAWQCALMRPDVFPTVSTISVPFQPRRDGRRPIAAFREITQRKGLGEFYMVAFQEPGRAEAEFDADIERTMRFMMAGLDNAATEDEHFRMFVTPGRSLLPSGEPGPLPAWLVERDLAVFVDAYRARGFRGPLNWYRNIDRNWELTSALQGATVRQPALYLTGERDPVRAFAGAHERAMPENVPGLERMLEIPQAGHWVHQERPEIVNDALLAFLEPHRNLASSVAPH